MTIFELTQVVSAASLSALAFCGFQHLDFLKYRAAQEYERIKPKAEALEVVRLTDGTCRVRLLIQNQDSVTLLIHAIKCYVVKPGTPSCSNPAKVFSWFWKNCQQATRACWNPTVTTKDGEDIAEKTDTESKYLTQVEKYASVLVTVPDFDQQTFVGFEIITNKGRTRLMCTARMIGGGDLPHDYIENIVNYAS